MKIEKTSHDGRRDLGLDKIREELGRGKGWLPSLNTLALGLHPSAKVK